MSGGTRHGQGFAEGVERAPPDGLTDALIKAHLARGSVRLLLDGLDEVPVSEPRDGTTLYPRALLAPLAENPMLLTALCVIYGNGGRLPEDRYHHLPAPVRERPGPLPLLPVGCPPAGAGQGLVGGHRPWDAHPDP